MNKNNIDYTEAVSRSFTIFDQQLSDNTNPRSEKRYFQTMNRSRKSNGDTSLYKYSAYNNTVRLIETKVQL